MGDDPLAHRLYAVSVRGALEALQTKPGAGDGARVYHTTATATMIVISVAGWPIMLRPSADAASLVSAARAGSRRPAADGRLWMRRQLAGAASAGSMLSASIPSIPARPSRPLASRKCAAESPRQAAHIVHGRVALARLDRMHNVNAREDGTVTFESGGGRRRCYRPRTIGCAGCGR
jgi:hypothetical protein